MLEVQYLQLYQAYPESWREDQPAEVTIAELTLLWNCSDRNVKMILKKMEACGWIEWRPGRGRGHASRLRCLAEAEAILLGHAQEFVQKGQLQEALSLLDRFGQGQDAKAQFMDWLSAYFGYSSEQKTAERKETLRLPVFRTVPRLDPAITFYALEAHLVKQIYNTLVTFHPRFQTIEPQLAHYWEMSPDGLEWKFYLRRGVMFHHGREMTAQDVAFTFERLMDRERKLPQSWLFEQLVEVRVLDTWVIRFRLSRPNHLFLRYLCFPASCILPSDRPVAGSFDPAGRKSPPSGTGPFSLIEWNESRVVLEAHKAYFEGRPHLDRVELTIVPEEEQSRLKAPVLDQVLCIHGGGPLPEGAGYEAIQLINDGCTMMTYNLKKAGPQQDVRFRNALHHLVDRKTMVETLGKTAASRHPGSSPMNTWFTTIMPSIRLLPGGRWRKWATAGSPSV
ncbi:ABC transporter substrate-binding protein [Paenibacillus sp. P25]|nr:ABC transporter substrate-binding protein [Paenibacillus sp. P25]